jgi:hypothetical protein
VTVVQSVHLGTVVEASVQRFLAQTVVLNQPPSVGSIVRVDDRGATIFGVVAGATTESIDPGRRPYVRDGGPMDADSYLSQNPHLAQLYRTTFEAIVVGHEIDGVVLRYLPPMPVRLYSGVFVCSDEDVCGLFGPSPWTRLDLLPLLLGGSDGSMDEVLGAFLRRSAQATGQPRAFLLAAGKELAVLLSRDPSRLNGILRRIRP